MLSKQIKDVEMRKQKRVTYISDQRLRWEDLQLLENSVGSRLLEGPRVVLSMF